MSVGDAAVRAPVTRSRWLGIGGAALVDQALFAGATFAVTILLARWLPAVEYGAFALAFSIFLLVAAVHTAVLTEPLLVFGASRYADRFRSYVGVVLAGHALLTGAGSLVLCLVALGLWLAGAGAAAAALAALAVAAPFVLALWLLRRAFYVSHEPHRAIAGDAIFLAVLVGGIALLQSEGALSAPRAFLIMALGGLAGSAVLVARLRPQLRGATGPSARAVARDHWGYGSWNVVGQGAFLASGQILVVLVPLVLGLEELAVLMAALNLFRPLNVVLPSIGALVLPEAARRASSGADGRVLLAQLRRLLLVNGGAVLAYGAVVSFFAEPILHYLYGGRYDGYATIVALFALTYATSAVVQVITLGLKATGNVRSVPRIWGVSALVTVLFSVPMMLLAGLTGAMVVVAASYLVAALVAWRRARLALVTA